MVLRVKENYSLSYHEKKIEIKIKEKYERSTDTLWYKRKIYSSLLLFGMFGWLIRIRIKF